MLRLLGTSTPLSFSTFSSERVERQQRCVVNKSMSTPDALTQRYNPVLVVISFAVSMLGAFSALQIVRVAPIGPGTRLSRSLRLLWTAVCLGGVCIWCCHAIGMEALELIDANGNTVPVAYDPLITALDFCGVVGVLFVAFLVVGDRTITAARMLIGTLLGSTALPAMVRANCPQPARECAVSPRHCFAALYGHDGHAPASEHGGWSSSAWKRRESHPACLVPQWNIALVAAAVIVGFVATTGACVSWSFLLTETCSVQ